MVSFCPNCNKKLGNLKTGLVYRTKDKRFCSIKCKKQYGKKQKIDNKEYKRKCNRCGKVWYSSVLKEKELERELKKNRSYQVATGFGMLAGSWLAAGAGMQTNRNKNALQDSLNKLRKCPNCSSITYKEKIV
ncbi:MAG: hypothetical protein JSW08_02470 [archaeon]|nr:MAG: hypothetical protein JSW08_02470 [archaeon]